METCDSKKGAGENVPLLGANKGNAQSHGDIETVGSLRSGLNETRTCEQAPPPNADESSKRSCLIVLIPRLHITNPRLSPPKDH